MNSTEDQIIKYQAIFINPADVKTLVERQKEKLPQVVKDMHCTFKFQPSKEEISRFSQLLGKNLTLKVVGYCSDGKNSGYEIELSPEQSKVYSNTHTVNNKNSIATVERTTPHITVSMSEGAKAVDTGMLPFSRKDFEPFIIHGKAGFYITKTIDKKKTSEITFEPVSIE